MTEIPYSHETELNEVLDRCNAVRMAPVPEANSLPEGSPEHWGTFRCIFLKRSRTPPVCCPSVCSAAATGSS